ncbi:regulator of microtubule dynamics protein 1 isoform X3 [Passer domesticus]|uniref:regulator of microtubule dynamics protein 1 isoform X3 n=1 Tax=Passer domesticus TaxID=48849 RepID=UPI0030FF08E7
MQASKYLEHTGVSVDCLSWGSVWENPKDFSQKPLKQYFVLALEDVIEQADYLYGSGETEKLYRLLVQHKNSDDAELLWRLARSSRDLAQLGSTSAEEKKKLTYDSLEYAKKALEKNESNFAAHKWYGICLSDVGDYEGIKTKIGNAIIIKEHFQRAIELNPKDATTIHLIGIWCYSFAEMPWYQRKIAATLFATPPTSTFQEALRYFHMAEEADPNFYSKNLLFLGKTYLKLNNKKMALLWLSKAKEYPAQTEEDKQQISSARCRESLNYSLKLCRRILVWRVGTCFLPKHSKYFQER